MITLKFWQVVRGYFRVRAIRCALVALVMCVAVVQAAPDPQEEQRYADALIRMGLPDYAQIVLDRLKASGGAGPEYKALMLQASLSRGEFEAAKAVIAAEPDPNSLETWAMRVVLADAYFAWGKYPEANAIYTEFFEKYKDGPPEALRKFYVDSAYKFAQMLLLTNDRKGAVKSFETALKGKPSSEAKRQIEADASELLIKLAEEATGEERQKYIKQADEYINDLLWRQDVWFGKAIGMSAHIMKLRGDLDGAMKRVEYYKSTLKEIDEQLKLQSTEEEDLTALSPMAQVRYLLGVLLQDEAQKILKAGGDKQKAQELLAGKVEPATLGKKERTIDGAAQHFGNVFIRYPNTKWAGDAGARFEEVKTILEDKLGRQVSFEPTPEQWLRVEKEQLKAARAVFNQKRFADAAELYETALVRFPNASENLGVLVDLASCYIELGNDLYADTVIRFIAERFKHGDSLQPAGNQVLALAGAYEERNRPERKEAVYETFFEHLSQHAMAARLLYSYGEKSFAAGNWTNALGYYERVSDSYEGTPLGYDAMSKMAACYNKLAEPAKEIKTLDAYTKKLIANKRLGPDLIRGLYRLGHALRKYNAKYYPLALKKYSEIITRLTDNPDAYQSGADEAARNTELLGAAMYYKAYCFTKIPAPEGKHPLTYKAAAIKGFMELANKFPKSDLAPAALSQAGTLYTVLGKAEEAQQAFARLKKNYPETPEARNVDFMLGMTLLDLGMRDKAVSVFKQMFAGDGRFSDLQILTAGNELFKAGEYAIAVEAFDRVLSMSQERSRQEPALAGKGRAYVAMGQFDKGADALAKLFEEFPKTAYTVDAAFDLSRAYAELGAKEPDSNTRIDVFNASINAMKKVLKYDPSRRVEASVEVGRIQELKAIAEEKLGDKAEAATYIDKAIAAYQSVILLEDPSETAIRPFIAKAYHECIRLFIATERWEDALNDADRFLELFSDTSKYVLDIRQWRSRARAKLISQGQGGDTEGEPAANDAAPVEAETESAE